MNTQKESLRGVLPETRDALISLIDQRVQQKLGDKFPTKEDFSELKGITKDLAQAQQRTELRVKELAQAQQRTELRVEELAQAQQRTERELRMLARQVGGLSERLGGSLEDLSYDVLPACLEKYYDHKFGNS